MPPLKVFTSTSDSESPRHQLPQIAAGFPPRRRPSVSVDSAPLSFTTRAVSTVSA